MLYIYLIFKGKINKIGVKNSNFYIFLEFLTPILFKDIEKALKSKPYQTSGEINPTLDSLIKPLTM